MSQIVSQVAATISDGSRPVQTQRDHALQIAVARQRTIRATDDVALTTDDAPESDDFRTAVAQVKQVIEAASNRQLSFTVDDSSKTLVVRVSTKDGMVLRQIPSEEVLKMRERIKELVGALIDESA